MGESASPVASDGIDVGSVARVSGIQCLRCGADWNGAYFRDACPQCKSPMEETIRVAALDPQTLTIVDDALCPGCDYNLRTLHLNSMCPECATPVAQALRPSIFLYAKHVSIRRLRAGVRSWLIGQGLVLAFIGGVFALVVSPIRGDSLFGVLMIALVIATFVSWLVGALLLTAPRIRQELALKRDWPRQIGRWLLVFALVIQPLFAIFGSLLFSSAFPIVGGMWPLLFVQFIPSLFLLGVAFVLLHLRQIARLTERRGLASFTTVTLWMCGIISLFIGAGSAVSYIGMSRAIRVAMSVPATAAYMSSSYGSGPGNPSRPKKPKPQTNNRGNLRRVKATLQNPPLAMGETEATNADGVPDESAFFDPEADDSVDLSSADSDDSSSERAAEPGAPGAPAGSSARAATTAPSQLVALGYATNSSGASSTTPATPAGAAPVFVPPAPRFPAWWTILQLVMGAIYLATIACFILGAILLIRYYRLFDELLTHTEPRST